MQIEIKQIDALKLLKGLEDNSVDLVATDPPYYQIKDLDWDNQWDTEQEFLAWLESIIIECARVLKPSGSFYMFTSNKMASKIEAIVNRYIVVKNHIVWHKINGLHQKVCKAKQRAYFPATERVIFAVCEESEKRDQNKAYSEACDPIIKYFRKALNASGLTQSQINKSLKTQMAGHWFGRSQWRLPSKEVYKKLQKMFKGSLSIDYEDLKQQRDDLLTEKNTSYSRVFNVDHSEFNTDVWRCSPVQYYEGKHPCEKPQAIMQHILSASSRPDNLVVDQFVGGGSTPLACAILGRRFIGSELDANHVEAAKARINDLSQTP